MIYQFSNGLKMVHKQLDGVRSVALCVLVGAGCANETEENNGISHFIEHMMFKGTSRRTSFEITRDIDDIGAQINAFTTKQNTCYYTVSVDEYAEQCMDILSDIFFNSTFPEDELTREKGVVLEEISMSEDDPSDLCLDYLSNIYFQGNTLGFNILGERKNIKKFTRKELFDYVARQYCTSNSVIAVVGNIDFETAKDMTQRYFADQFKCAASVQWADAPHRTTSGSIVKVKDIEQANVGIVFPCIQRFDKNEHALTVMNTVFGSGMSSRLFQNIREKQGLAYNVFSYASSYTNNGNLAIYMGTNYDSVKQAVATVREEILSLIDKGLSAEEIERGKRQIKGAFVLGQESTSTLMRVYARHALFAGTMFDFDEYLDKIDSVTSEEIDSLARKIFDFDQVSTAYVGRAINTDIMKVIKGE